MGGQAKHSALRHLLTVDIPMLFFFSSPCLLIGSFRYIIGEFSVTFQFLRGILLSKKLFSLCHLEIYVIVPFHHGHCFLASFLTFVTCSILTYIQLLYIYLPFSSFHKFKYFFRRSSHLLHTHIKQILFAVVFTS